jgi:hypothetical protein
MFHQKFPGGLNLEYKLLMCLLIGKIKNVGQLYLLSTLIDQIGNSVKSLDLPIKNLQF